MIAKLSSLNTSSISHPSFSCVSWLTAGLKPDAGRATSSATRKAPFVAPSHQEFRKKYENGGCLPSLASLLDGTICFLYRRVFELGG
jgi:hypothetical protein